MGETVDVIVLGEGRDQSSILMRLNNSLQVANLAAENAVAEYPRYL